MSSAGLSKSRLERMHHVLSGYVERQELPGLVALVGYHDDAHVETLGTLAFGDAAPMKRDTIFRIASLTKPITAVAAMLLVEDCQVRLDDSVEAWLPELANRRVLKSISSDLDDTVPAMRAITLRDLLTYRMGFGSVMAMPDTYPIQKFIREYRIGGDGPPRPSQAPGTEEWLQKLGSLPWMAQPGERWLYNVSGDVLGVLIARVSGQPFGVFLQERLGNPTAVRVGRRWVGLDDRGLLRLQSHAAEQRPVWSRAGALPRQRGADDSRSPHAGATRRGRDLFRRACQLGPGPGSGYRAQRHLPDPRPLRVDRRSGHHSLHRSSGGHDRHPLHAAPDGFAATPAGLQRFLDTGVYSDGISKGQRARAGEEADRLRRLCSGRQGSKSFSPIVYPMK